MCINLNTFVPNIYRYLQHAKDKKRFQHDRTDARSTFCVYLDATSRRHTRTAVDLSFTRLCGPSNLPFHSRSIQRCTLPNCYATSRDTRTSVDPWHTRPGAQECFLGWSRPPHWDRIIQYFFECWMLKFSVKFILTLYFPIQVIWKLENKGKSEMWLQLWISRESWKRTPSLKWANMLLKASIFCLNWMNCSVKY